MLLINAAACCISCRMDAAGNSPLTANTAPSLSVSCAKRSSKACARCEAVVRHQGLIYTWGVCSRLVRVTCAAGSVVDRRLVCPLVSLCSRCMTRAYITSANATCPLRAEAEHDEVEALPELKGPGCKLLLMLAEQRCFGVSVLPSPLAVDPADRRVVVCMPRGKCKSRSASARGSQGPYRPTVPVRGGGRSFRASTCVDVKIGQRPGLGSLHWRFGAEVPRDTRCHSAVRCHKSTDCSLQRSANDLAV